jgi:hypothetical protein
MRANAPAFTPSSASPVFVPMIPQDIPDEHPWGMDPYGVYPMQGRPMYASYPQSGLPGQPPVMAPVYPVRMVPGPAPFTGYPGPYPAPAPYPYPQPQLPQASQTSPPSVAKRFPQGAVPPKLPSGPTTPTYPHNPAFVVPPGQRLPYPPAPFYPNGPRPPMGAPYEDTNRDQT